jgi:galactonate dehydratase
MKVVIIPCTHYSALLHQVDRTARMVGALRDAVGPEVEIMVDFHGRPASVGAALAYIDEVRPGRPMFVEEVLPPGDSVGLREIASKTSVPIATGERLVELTEFEELFRHRSISIAQPDICHCGGLWETKKIAAMPEAAGIGLAPHNPLGPIAGVAALHFAVSTSNHVIQEEMVGAVPWYFEVVRGPIKMIDGFWQVPTAPGLGVEVDEAECVRHPYEPETPHTVNAVLDDGTIVDW